MIYFDNAATTKMHPSVLDAMLPYLREDYFNASAQYAPAQNIKRKVEECRAYMAATLGAKPSEIRFTSGGTESDNWALKGIALANKGKGNHIVISAIEHHAVLNSAVWLERNGFSVSYVYPNAEGIIEPSSLVEALTPETILVSVMAANNEVGAIQPIQQLAGVAHRNGSLFHTDAVQAYAHIPLNIEELGVDALSVSAHKFHGPKGAGLLYCRKGIPIESFLHGGAQERGYRAGTENLPAIAGMTEAAKLVFGESGTDITKLKESAQRLQAIKNQMQNSLIREVPDVRVNSSAQGLPGILSVSFKGVSAESVLLLLSQKGICASAGSACASGSLEPSHVLQAMGVSNEWARGTLRFSFSSQNTVEEAEEAACIVASCVKQVREAGF